MTIEVLDIEPVREIQTHLIGELAVFFALIRCAQHPPSHPYISENLFIHAKMIATLSWHGMCVTPYSNISQQLSENYATRILLPKLDCKNTRG